MKTNIEIEFKSLLTIDEYNSLCSSYIKNSTNYSQTNYYFNDKNNFLKKNKISVRIREKDRFKITSKIPKDNHLIEHSVFISEKEFTDYIKNGFDANIVNVDTYVYYQTKLKTERVKILINDNDILFLDKNYYFNTIDYELEYETNDYEKGKSSFEKLIQNHNIIYKPSISKMLRATNKKGEL
ncbi:MAG: CYTH domain-containing protein [Anaeroplasmataceae bacterium]